jgi:4-hydroxy-tetrahydrodipicolinate synthase
MTGFAVPELLVRIMRLYRGGKVQEAADYFHRRVSLMRFEYQEGIGMAVRKEVLRRRGAIATAATRAPAPRPDAFTLSSLDMLLTWFLNEEKEFPWTLA